MQPAPSSPTSPTSPPVPSRGPAARAARQEAILAAAAAAFARAGYAATSMDDIAAEAGITKLVVYRYFESKEDLYRAVLKRVFDRLAEEFLVAYSADPMGFAVGARAMIAVARENPDGFRLLWRHAAREPEFAAYAQELREHAVNASRELLRSWTDPLMREWAAETIVGYLVEATLNWIDHGRPERDGDVVERMAVAVRAAVRA
ncbi:MAG: helix-turn-helix transcriptional regulator [Acidimicrobiia bacterium]|nr:helix-turn-helix transcriptional regulator [Acidimicrobiia bacterium]